MIKDKDGLRLPSDRAIRGFFSRVFVGALPTWMRTPPSVYGSDDVGSLEVDQIDQAVQGLDDRPVRTASVLPTFDRVATQGRLSVADKREALLSFALDKARERELLDDDHADALLDEFLAISSPPALTKLLNHDELAAKLEAELPTRSVPSPTPFGDAFASERGVLAASLNGEHLRYSNADPDVQTHADTAARREATRNADVARWHQLSRGVGITSLPEPALPPFRDAREGDAKDPPRTTYVDDWLDSSLEGRLRGALYVNRESRLGIPDERALLDPELDRAVAPLGLQDHHSQLLLALGIALVIGFDKDPADTRASSIVGRQFASWYAVKQILAGRAAIPDLIVNIVDDPLNRHNATLWRRAHGHHVRGTVARPPHEVWRTLIGVGTMAGRRLGELSRKLSNQLRQETRDSLGERVETAVQYTLFIGVDAPVLQGFSWNADPSDPADVAQWGAWAMGAGVRITLKQLVQWRAKNRPE